MNDRATDSVPSAGEDRGSPGLSSAAAPEPGLVLLFAAGHPYQLMLPVGAQTLPLGRGGGFLPDHPDFMMSRRHAEVAYRAGSFEVTDLGSRNGSAIDGVPFTGTRTVPPGTLLRFGHSLFVCCADLTPWRQFGLRAEGGRVEGPALRQLLATVSQLAKVSRTLFIYGESGAGKESMAHTFHHAGAQSTGPLIAVNCAAIPQGVAERLLFGSRKGAFSGATSDSEGYIEAAHGGTLFLDEVAELDESVQGKLLRVIESGELLPLGATRPRKVQFRVCIATHKDLRALAQAGKFRADLYFRIGMPQVAIPPLRQRREEIPWLIRQAVTAVAPELAISTLLVQACMLRAWPGNVRELLTEVSTGALSAHASKSATLSEHHLRPQAGAAMTAVVAQPGAPEGQLSAQQDDAAATPAATAAGASPGQAAATKVPSRAEVQVALLEAKGNVSAAARAMGLHRTNFRRLLVRYKIDTTRLRELGHG